VLEVAPAKRPRISVSLVVGRSEAIGNTGDVGFIRAVVKPVDIKKSVCFRHLVILIQIILHRMPDY
jgi:hypothetical protein